MLRVSGDLFVVFLIMGPVWSAVCLRMSVSVAGAEADWPGSLLSGRGSWGSWEWRPHFLSACPGGLETCLGIG